MTYPGSLGSAVGVLGQGMEGPRCSLCHMCGLGAPFLVGGLSQPPALVHGQFHSPPPIESPIHRGRGLRDNFSMSV